jgi:proteasome assembly chaperone (PAC2) family protein
MDFLKLDNPPKDLETPIMLFAFEGWADAAESATHALRYLIRRLKATKFAEIDPEEFYNFARVRPFTKFDDDGNRYIEWPANEFYFHKGEGDQQDVIIFVGVEPNLRWRTFSELLVGVVKDLGVSKAIHVGALLDAVPHTRSSRVSGTATSPELRGTVNGLRVRRSRYTGPAGITTAVTEVMKAQGIPTMSLWGHTPHYLQVSPNPKVSRELIQGLQRLLNIEVDLEPLKSQGKNFERRVDQALADEPEVVAYVEKLEAQWDSGHEGPPEESMPDGEGSEGTEDIEMPEPGQAVQGIEEFLRQAREARDSEDKKN